MKRVLAGLSMYGLLQELRQRIRDSYEARWKAEKHFDEDQILNEMPGSLRIEVTMRSACGTSNMTAPSPLMSFSACVFAAHCC